MNRAQRGFIGLTTMAMFAGILYLQNYHEAALFMFWSLALVVLMVYMLISDNNTNRHD